MPGQGRCSEAWAFAKPRNAKLGDQSVPGHGSEPDVPPACSQPPRTEPVTQQTSCLLSCRWALGYASHVGEALLSSWPLRPNSGRDVSQRPHLQTCRWWHCQGRMGSPGVRSWVSQQGEPPGSLHTSPTGWGALCMWASVERKATAPHSSAVTSDQGSVGVEGLSATRLPQPGLHTMCPHLP